MIEKKKSDREPRERMLDDAFAAGIGIVLKEIEPGRAVSVIEITATHINGEGVGQGGVMFTLADFTFAAAANAYGPSALALDGHVIFHKPAFQGDILTAEATEISRGRTVGRYEVQIRNQDETLVATFLGTAYIKQ